MKLSRFVSLVAIGLLVIGAASGCKKKPGYVTPLPPGMTKNPKDLENANALKGGESTDTKIVSESIPSTDSDKYKNYAEDRDMFKSETVHFAFDSSAVQAAEKPKVAKVADYLKANADKAIKVEGNCDERGTEEYNRSLGERRALAVREELVSLGVDAGRVVTISFGEDKPVATGHDDAAWKQNRRADFVLLSPPK
jgi:peptidoglycan-associated lipoprotein